MDISLLAPCNYYCGNCILYKKSKCLGCARASRKAEAEGRVFCDVSLCAKNASLATCSDCQTYPCEKYDKAIFSESFVKWIRDRLKEAQ